jgi:hypothetical protein
MKRLIWTVGGICAAAAGALVWGSKRTPNVEDLTDRPEGDGPGRHAAAYIGIGDSGPV